LIFDRGNRSFKPLWFGFVHFVNQNCEPWTPLEQIEPSIESVGELITLFVITNPPRVCEGQVSARVAQSNACPQSAASEVPIQGRQALRWPVREKTEEEFPKRHVAQSIDSGREKAAES
jgi:hypothetical protein